MKIYTYGLNGIFLGVSVADESPLEPGVFLIPAFATHIQPPAPQEGIEVVFINDRWQQRNITQPEPPPPQPELTTEELIAQYEAALDAHLDAVAQANRYRDRFTFAQRATRPGPWYAEGCAFYDWMETCNAQAFALLSEVQAGNAVMPTIDAFIDSLPEFSL